MPCSCWLVIVPGAYVLVLLRLPPGGLGPNVGLSTLCGAVTGLPCGGRLNFGPFGSEPGTTGSKRKPILTGLANSVAASVRI